MPVIDDPMSMIRCTNKVFLMELLGSNQVPMPQTVMLAEDADLPKAMDEEFVTKIIEAASGSSAVRSSAESASTTAGSNWVPAQRTSSASASRSGIARRYARSDVIASKASATKMMRAPSGIWSPASLFG